MRDDPSPYAVLGRRRWTTLTPRPVCCASRGRARRSWPGLPSTAPPSCSANGSCPAEAREHVIEGTLDLVGGGLLAATSA